MPKDFCTRNLTNSGLDYIKQLCVCVRVCRRLCSSRSRGAVRCVDVHEILMMDDCETNVFKACVFTASNRVEMISPKSGCVLDFPPYCQYCQYTALATPSINTKSMSETDLNSSIVSTSIAIECIGHCFSPFSFEFWNLHFKVIGFFVFRC